jgi:hypothetical protein
MTFVTTPRTTTYKRALAHYAADVKAATDDQLAALVAGEVDEAHVDDPDDAEVDREYMAEQRAGNLHGRNVL